jgi:O-antigen ligase
LETATAALTSAAVVAVIFSIAVSQILLAAALLSLLLSRRPWHVPVRLIVPLAAFAAWTLLAVIFSSDPAAGFPQVRKLSIFFLALLVTNAFAERSQIRLAVLGIVVAGMASALYGLAQFSYAYYRIQHQGLPFYENYVLHQITGFMSHWMTFGGLLMLVLMLLLSVLLFGETTRWRQWGWVGVALILAALLAAFTRGIWIGAAAGALYLLGSYRRWLLWVLPALLLLAFLLAPVWLQRRGESIFASEGDSSVEARLLMYRTGLRMIASHPVFGVGPERVGPEFAAYMPGGTVRPPGWYGHLHNTVMQLSAERGIVVGLCLIWLLIEVILYNVRRLRGPELSGRFLERTAIASTLAIMAAGLFEYNLGDSEVLILYLALIFLPLAWARANSAPPPSPQLPSSQPQPSATA